MKLHLPSLLLSALVAAQMCATATAATVVGSGVFYDVGKNAYSSDPTITNKEDSLYCWATAGSNMVQYWQDTYYKYHDKGETPANGVGTSYDAPYGTAYLEMYKEVLKKGQKDTTGFHTDFIDWWFKGTEHNSWGTVLPKQNGYYDTLSSGVEAVSERNLAHDEKNFGKVLDSIFSTQGQLAGLSFLSVNVEQQTMDRAHAITCMGYEKNKDGVVTALILADADDEYFGAVRVNVNYDERFAPVRYDYPNGESEVVEYPTGGSAILFSDDISYDYGRNLVFLNDVSQIVTPKTYKNEAGDVVTVAQTAEHANVDITKAAGTTTSLDAPTSVKGNTVTVGDGSNIVVLTTDNGEELSLDGRELAATGLKVNAGSLASLQNVVVTGYANGGIDGVGHTYFHDDSLNLFGNSTQGNGAGASNSSYMEIKDNKNGVAVYSNTAGGADSVGGGIANNKGSVLSIRGNSSVYFANNTATKGGNDIYNAEGGTVIIADNATVTFASHANDKAAVTNDGELYLANKADQNIIFDHSSLDGKGVTYIGKDNRSSDYDGKVTFKGDGQNAMTVAANKAASTVAALQNLSVSLNEINGTTASQSSISGAAVATNGDLNVSKLTMDTTSTLAAGGNVITLSEVVIDLSNVDGTTGTDGALTYDLSGLLTASTVKLDNIVFDAHGLELTKDQEVVVTLGNNTLNGTAFLLTADGLREQTKLIDGSVHFSANSPIVPEPATTTLSLLALAGLCARRRRK